MTSIEQFIRENARKQREAAKKSNEQKRNMIRELISKCKTK